MGVGLGAAGGRGRGGGPRRKRAWKLSLLRKHMISLGLQIILIGNLQRFLKMCLVSHFT